MALLVGTWFLNTHTHTFLHTAVILSFFRAHHCCLVWLLCLNEEVFNVFIWSEESAACEFEKLPWRCIIFEILLSSNLFKESRPYALTKYMVYLKGDSATQVFCIGVFSPCESRTCWHNKYLQFFGIKSHKSLSVSKHSEGFFHSGISLYSLQRKMLKYLLFSPLLWGKKQSASVSLSLFQLMKKHQIRMPSTNHWPSS